MTGNDVRQPVGHGSSTAADPVVAARECVRAALDGRVPAPGDLVMVFATIEYDPYRFFPAAAEAAAPAQVVGCTAYASFTSATFVPQGASAAFVPAADLTFGVAAVDSVGSDIRTAAERVTETARQRAGADAEHSALMMLSDGLAGDQREVVRGSYAVTGATVPMVGGAAAEDVSMTTTYQFADGKVMSNGLVAIWINAPHPLGIGVEHGWYPIGDPMVVTRAENNIIHELDGRPAVEVYLENRATALPENALDQSFALMTYDHPLGLANAAGNFDGRHILGRTPEGALVVFGYVSEQSVVQVLAGDRGDLLDAAERAAATAVDRLTTAPRGAIVFSCTGRVAPLGEAVGTEATAIGTGLNGVPFAGFFTYGEFARVTGSVGFHNATVVVLAL